jgi:hypothetical protein
MRLKWVFVRDAYPQLQAKETFFMETEVSRIPQRQS